MGAIRVLGDHPRAHRLREMAKKERFHVGEVEALEAEPKGFTVWVSQDAPPPGCHAWCRPHSDSSAEDEIKSIKTAHAAAGVEILIVENLARHPDLPTMHVSYSNDRVLRVFHTDRDIDLFLLSRAAHSEV